MQSDTDGRGREAVVRVARVEGERQSHKPDVLDAILVYDGGVVEAGLQAFGVHGDVCVTGQTSFVDAFLTELQAVVWAVRIWGMCTSPCRGRRGHGYLLCWCGWGRAVRAKPT